MSSYWLQDAAKTIDNMEYQGCYRELALEDSRRKPDDGR